MVISRLEEQTFAVAVENGQDGSIMGHKVMEIWHLGTRFALCGRNSDSSPRMSCDIY